MSVGQSLLHPENLKKGHCRFSHTRIPNLWVYPPPHPPITSTALNNRKATIGANGLGLENGPDTLMFKMIKFYVFYEKHLTITPQGKRFLTELKPKIPDDLKEASCDDADLINDAVVNSTVCNGSLGKTAQFWMLYIDTMNMQMIGNDFDLQRVSWKSFLPYYFAFNLHNYARYASYYVEVLDCIDGRYPGLRQTLSQSGLSVQAQERYVRTAIDRRGEQTINRDAKTSGGISQFAARG